MRAFAPKTMTTTEFIEWALNRPDGERYELLDGEVVAMSPERARHARTKLETAIALREAIRDAGLPCEAFPDGMSVRIDARTAFEPDALVRCGPPLDDEAVEVTDPVIVVGVTSPSTSNVDLHTKLERYFQVPSIRHYLVVVAQQRLVIHHVPGPDGSVVSRFVRSGSLELDPPGVTLDVERLFMPPAA